MTSPASAPIELGALVDRSIALCGFMGVGKSTVGRKLAGQLCRPFVDADLAIADELGLPIVELFQVGKEALFRTTEARVVTELAKQAPPLVIALGGGAYDNASTREILRDHAFVIHLDQSFDALLPSLTRLRNGRPLLMGRSDDELRALYEQRRSNYLLADLTVRLERTGTVVATRDVVKALNQYLTSR